MYVFCLNEHNYTGMIKKLIYFINYIIIIYHKLLKYFLQYLDPLGEFDKVYRDEYIQNCNDFMANVKRFGDEHKKVCFEISRNELNSNDEQQKSVYDKRITEWETYKVR